jgi:hypothetical protein
MIKKDWKEPIPFYSSSPLSLSLSQPISITTPGDSAASLVPDHDDSVENEEDNNSIPMSQDSGTTVPFLYMLAGFLVDSDIKSFSV